MTELPRRDRGDPDTLAEQNRMLTAMIAQLPGWVYRCRNDALWPIEFAGGAIKELTGYTAEELVAGRPPYGEVIHPADRDKVWTDVQAAIQARQRFQLVYRIVTRSGAERWMWEQGVALHLDDGPVTHLEGFVTDITAFKHSEEDVANLSHRLELVLNSASEGIIGIDASGVATFVNPKACQLLGYSSEEIIGSTVHDLIHHTKPTGGPLPIDECAVAEAVIKGTTRHVLDDVFWRRDATALPVEYTVAPTIEVDAAVRAVIVFNETTERKLLHAQLEQARRITSLGRLAATIAHEFNNVLMGIQPFVEILRRRSDGPPDAVRAFDHIERAMQRGKTLTKNILRFASPAELEKQPMEVGSFLLTLRDELGVSMGENVDVEIKLPSEPLPFDADEAQLHQAVINIALNARDAMPQGGRFRICASRPTSGRYPFGAISNPHAFAHISMSDTGTGMPSDVVQRVFEPLFTTKKSGGTGLGLAYAHQVVTAHGGHIYAESRPDNGSTFHIFLPLADRNIGEVTDAVPTDDWGRDLPSRVLIIEDDLVVAAGLGAILRAEEIEVEAVTRGNEAPAAVERFRPDVIILDVNLPDMSGIDVFKQIASRFPRLPVIFSTGHAREAEVEDFLSPTVRLLAKPYSLHTLLGELRAVHARAASQA